jgi:hypothetical protein
MHIPFVLKCRLVLRNCAAGSALHARGVRRAVGGGGDGRGCRGRDKREDECIVLCGAGSLPAQPSVVLSALFELEGKGALQRVRF